MITKRRKPIAIILLAVIGGVIAFSLMRENDEPKYKGRPLSEWLERAEHSDTGVEAEVAIRNIGTNALPYLLKWIAYEPPAWRRRLRQNLPSSMRDNAVGDWIQGEATRRSSGAALAFILLGTNAASCISGLEGLMKDNTKPWASSRAIFALGHIGEPAISALKSGLADPKQLHPEVIIFAFKDMATTCGTNVCLPILRGALSHQSLSVRVQATNAVQVLERPLPPE